MNNSFSFFNVRSNDKISDLNKKDMNEFIKQLLKYKLHLRRNLSLNKELTFGLELEFEYIKNTDYFNKCFNLMRLNEGIVRSFVNGLHLWNLDTDMSLVSTNGEEITSPILIDDEKYWKDLVKMCSFIKKNAKIGDKSAGHIHIGSQIIGKDRTALMNFIKLWAVYENILYRYGYNEYLNKLEGIKYCNPAADRFNNSYKLFEKARGLTFEEMILELGLRKCAVNFLGVSNLSKNGFIANKDTIEFRSPNGTLDPIIWQNNVNTFIKMLLYSKSNKFDIDTILKRERNNTTIGNISEYNKIYLEEAIEFADLIFDNNLDKLYFLRQYIKNNDISNEPMVRTKKFTI